MNISFNTYTHSIPIIYSHLEGQYKCKLSDSKHSFQILFTEFGFHYVTGEIPKDENLIIDEIRKYINEHNPEELVLYGPTKEWEDFLSKVFSYIGGVIDFRLSFTLDVDEFRRIYEGYEMKHKVELVKLTDKKSSSPYFQAEVYDNENVISFSRAFMEGKGNAELDVWTDSKHRYQGLAFETSLVLVHKLLEVGLIPNWSCWEPKKASQMLAYKLGFGNPVKIKAFIWTNEFGSF